MARLDRLGTVKEVAQLAACIGREFSHEMLASTSTLDADLLGVALDRLMKSELIRPVSTPSAGFYMFSHALVQAAAYQSLLKSRRRELHARIAQSLNSISGNLGASTRMARAINLAHTLPRDPVSACLPPTPLHRCIGLRVRSLNDPHDARLRPFNRHTLEPAAASRCEPTHPSPSAC